MLKWSIYPQVPPLYCQKSVHSPAFYLPYCKKTTPIILYFGTVQSINILEDVILYENKPMHRIHTVLELRYEEIAQTCPRNSVLHNNPMHCLP